MPRNWEAIAAASDGDYTELEFQQALYQLVTQQCLYARFNQQSVAYRLISRYRQEFQEAVALMGLRLKVVDVQNYCFVTQDVAKGQAMDIRETTFVLTLRQLYHVRATASDLNSGREATVTLVELQEAFKSLTGKELDMRRASLETLMRTPQRQGLAKIVDPEPGDVQPFAILLLPGIAEIISEYAVNRFGAALKASLSAGAEIKGQDDTEEAQS